MGRTLLGVLGVVVLGSMVACMARPKEDVRAGGSGVSESTFDRNAVLDDKSLRDVGAMSVDDIQGFLEETPWGTTSVLATYEEDGKSAAEIIHEKAEAHGINPLELLVRAQMEQGLISKETASAKAISLAFGCGCPHSPVCGPKYRGFANQADCAAGTLRRSMDRATTATGTVSGWARSRSKETEDGLTVTPKNAATAALYTYTPYVGEAGGGREGVGGVSLHHQVWTRFAEFTEYNVAAPQTPQQNEVDAGRRPDAARTDAGAPPGEEEEGEEGETPPAGADAGPSQGGDAGAPPKKDDDENEGTDDDEILGQGNAPPSSNGPPPGGVGGKGKAEDLPLATEEELAGKKKKSSGGCSAAPVTGDASPAMIGVVLAAVLVGARRRRR